MLVAAVPSAGGEFRQGRRQRMHRIVGELRIGDMSLDTVYRQTAAQAAAPSDLDGVTEIRFAGGLADQTPIDRLPPLAQHLHDPARTVHRGPSSSLVIKNATVPR